MQATCIRTFLANANHSFVAMQSGPPATTSIARAVEIAPATPTFRNQDPSDCNATAGTTTNTCVFSVAAKPSEPGGSTASQGLDSYIDAIKGGATYLDYNFDPLYYTQAQPQYNTYCKKAVTLPAPAPMCVTSPTPSAPGPPLSYQLSVDVAFLLHAVDGGLQIRLAASPLKDTFMACGLTPASMTALQAEACIDPMLQAAVDYLGSKGIPVAQMLPWHEPTGYTALAGVTGQTFLLPDFTNMIAAGCAAVHQLSAGVAAVAKCGGGFTSHDNAPTPYVGDYVAHVVSGSNATSGVNIIGLETYGTAASETDYSGAMGTIASFCPKSKAFQLKGNTLPPDTTCENTEGDPPRHVPGSDGSEQNVYEGCAWDNGTQGWQTFGLNQAWTALMPQYLSANNFSSVTKFSTQSFAGFDPIPTQNCFLNGLDATVNPPLPAGQIDGFTTNYSATACAVQNTTGVGTAAGWAGGASAPVTTPGSGTTGNMTLTFTSAVRACTAAVTKNCTSIEVCVLPPSVSSTAYSLTNCAPFQPAATTLSGPVLVAPTSSQLNGVYGTSVELAAVVVAIDAKGAQTATSPCAPQMASVVVLPPPPTGLTVTVGP
jgi:hypothetical protein